MFYIYIFYFCGGVYVESPMNLAAFISVVHLVEDPLIIALLCAITSPLYQFPSNIPTDRDQMAGGREQLNISSCCGREQRFFPPCSCLTIGGDMWLVSFSVTCLPDSAWVFVFD